MANADTTMHVQAFIAETSGFTMVGEFDGRRSSGDGEASSLSELRGGSEGRS